MRNSEARLAVSVVALFAALLTPGVALAQTTDFRALPLPGLADGAEGYTAAASVIDPATGITLTGYAAGVRGGPYALAPLYRRNIPNDRGIGVCSEGQSTCDAGGGDVNELDNAGSWEIITLTRPAGKEWVSVQVSSMDDNGGGPVPETGVLWAASDPTNTATWTVITTIVGSAANREPTILIPDPHKLASYLIFEAASSSDPSGARDNDFLVWQATVFEPQFCSGTGSPGYWKNHPEAWPVDQGRIGGVTYSKEEAIEIMLASGRGDKTWTMFKALTAAKLNYVIGCGCGSIASTIEVADAWMASYGPVGSRVRGNSEAWKMGEMLYVTLDMYNNGYDCAPSRE